jgi:alpha-tubulin suppressor-like RCC1 family protein
VQVACGAEHSVALTAEGAALAFGAGDSGQLGRHASEYQSEADSFRPVRMLTNERQRIVQVSGRALSASTLFFPGSRCSV